MIVHAISSSISHIYLLAIRVGVAALLLSLTLPEVKLPTSLHPVADEIPLSNADPIMQFGPLFLHSFHRMSLA